MTSNLYGALVQINLDVDSWIADGFSLEELYHDKFGIVMEEIPSKYDTESGRCFLILTENSMADIWYEDALIFHS